MSNPTRAEYLAILARLQRHTPQEVAVPTDAVPDGEEAALHKDILDECARRGWIALHGSMVHRTYRIEGEWDFIIIADLGRVFLIECKTRTSKLDPAQRAIKHWAESLGHQSHVARSMGDFLRIVST